MSSSVIRATLLLVAAGSVAVAAPPTTFIALDQKMDRATLQRYHYIDQGVRFGPAAWIAAVEKADGSGRFMAAANLRQLGFIVDNPDRGPLNPYGWPVGFSVSEPRTPGEVPAAGITCAGCHTGQVNYRGTAIRIEGGQGMRDFAQYLLGLSEAFTATVRNPERRARFYAAAIAAGYPAERMEADFAAAVAGFPGLADKAEARSTTEGPGRSDAVQGIANQLFGKVLRVPENLRSRTAPVNVPPVFDAWRFNRVQYNGFGPGDKPAARNVGEVLGTFGRMNVTEAGTGALIPEPLRWKTSVQLDNLVWIERSLHSLQAPAWPAAVLGTPDRRKASAGKELFIAMCADCHAIRELPNGSWDVPVVSLKTLGTDPNAATNWAAGTYDASKLGLGAATTSWTGAPAVINAVMKQLYDEAGTPAAEREAPVEHLAPCGYKARPMIGIWATPPFLHNGSVRTLRDLLSETRPARFMLGSLEYDPVDLGYANDGALAPFEFDTTQPGNSNAGHWFTDDGARPGRIGPKLSAADQSALIEFLKAATYENYPRQKLSAPAAIACQSDQGWALKPSTTARAGAR